MVTGADGDPGGLFETRKSATNDVLMRSARVVVSQVTRHPPPSTSFKRSCSAADDATRITNQALNAMARIPENSCPCNTRSKNCGPSPYSLTHSLTHTHSHSLWIILHSHSLTHSLTHSPHTFTLTLTLPLTLALTLTLTLTHPLTHSHPLPYSLTPTPTHTLILTRGRWVGVTRVGGSTSSLTHPVCQSQPLTCSVAQSHSFRLAVGTVSDCSQAECPCMW